MTIGLSVDASVLIYERLREEMALGKSLKVAVQAAYEKAFSSIFDANVTTLITAAILFWKASGPVKGFAISLTLGILASLFTALIVGRNCLGWFRRHGPDQEDLDAAFDLLQEHQFSRQRFSRLHALACTAHRRRDRFFMRGEKNFGVDFRGGDLLTLSPPNPIDVGKMRAPWCRLDWRTPPFRSPQQGDKIT